MRDLYFPVLYILCDILDQTPSLVCFYMHERMVETRRECAEARRRHIEAVDRAGFEPNHMHTDEI